MNKRTENCFFFIIRRISRRLTKKKGVAMEYKGFKTGNIEKAIVDGNKDIWEFSVKIENSADYLKIATNELEDLEEKFHKTIDEYIKMCEQYKKNPYQ